MLSLRIAASALLALSLASCASTKTEKPSAKTAFVASPENPAGKPLAAGERVPMEPAAWFKPNRPRSGLAGRTLEVDSIQDIKLGPKEVALTFDDGPVPGRTERILDTLTRYDVKATFLMVGEMAKAHPAIARKVADAGHSIGSHTWSHADLHKLSFDQAMADITKGELAVKAGTGMDPAFFRFPYLSDSKSLRTRMAQRNVVVLDVAIDSKDYFRSSPSEIVERTMATLHRRGRGIILMHDLHLRTAVMLPMLLERLKAEGYKVVALRHERKRTMMLASAD
ncbi:polysaccharide deacetylase family protein [Rhizobium daejeonense]|uniref:Chitooligosaccharide deacetylase n=1 Tax=Rhizobium daejeonense TaxID=240521 RepID=A0A6M1RWA5_9HYPH|nr:polysaccharide deacetylase family protein [Rhizobium daejeonense]NGO63175.1 polysaccharide deacetylase family protein [Rhizobium daejeonense]